MVQRCARLCELNIFWSVICGMTNTPAKTELQIHEVCIFFLLNSTSRTFKCLFTEMLVPASAIDRGCNVMQAEKTQQSWCQGGGCASQCFDNDCHVQVLITFAKEVLSAGLLKNYWPDFLETCWNCVAWAKGKCIKFLEWIHFIFHFC